LDYDYVLHIVNFAILYDTNFYAPDTHYDKYNLLIMNSKC
jgi:hypothetical protein